MKNIVDLSRYNNVFCDSNDALLLANRDGLLSRNALIRSSSPALLWKKSKNIVPFDATWSTSRMKKFQSEIGVNSRKILDMCVKSDQYNHSEALTIASSFISFNKFLFKAACLNESDLTEKRLYIKINTKKSKKENRLNSPIERLLHSNKDFYIKQYFFDEYSSNSINSTKFWTRIKFGGIETIIYRLSLVLSKLIPKIFKRRQALIVGENEILIETASNLFLKGFYVKKIHQDCKISGGDRQAILISNEIIELVRHNIKKWVDECFVEKCLEVFLSDTTKLLNDLLLYKSNWRNILSKEAYTNNVIITNAPGSVSGFALKHVSQEMNIKVVSFQHGVTHEICEPHEEVSVHYDINSSDYMISYNDESKLIMENYNFFNASIITCGMSKRHLRVENNNLSNVSVGDSFVYLSTNLYRGNIGWFGTYDTDYQRAIKEYCLINESLSKIPYMVCYKRYPEENKRYIDKDPIIDEINRYDNIEVCDDGLDARYSLGKYKVIITSGATSTLSWAILTNKPVVLINSKNNISLRSEVLNIFSKSIFLFDDSDYDFHIRLNKFLSLPVEDIYTMWSKKKHNRQLMIKKYFNKYDNGKSGEKAGKFIYQMANFN